MNLQQVTAAFVAAVNPPIDGTLYVSSGPAQQRDYSLEPTFAPGVPVSLQVQALAAGDLRHIDSLGIQGTMRAIYLKGLAEGANRPSQKGGDVLQFADPSGQFGPTWWLVTEVLEPWSESAGWTKVVATMQDAKPAGIA